MSETAKDLTYLAKSYTNFSGIELPEVNQYNQTFVKPLLRVGTSTYPAKISTTTIPLTDVQATCALTTGTVNPVNIALAQTGVALGGGILYGLNVVITAESGIELTDVERGVIKDALVRLNKEQKLTPNHLSLYEKFVEDKKEA